MSGAARRRVAIGFVAVVALLLVHNLVWMVRNQTGLPCDQRVCRAPRDLEAWARSFAHPRVSAQLANFYLLRQRVPAATVTIPPWMVDHEWYFLEVARMRVVLSPVRLEVDDVHLERLLASRSHKRRWLRRGGSEKRWLFQDLYLFLDGDATEYVLAETSSYYGPLLLLPADEFARVAKGAAP